MSNQLTTKCLYYSLILNQQKFFKNEVLEELLRERINYYNSKKIKLNFWITLLSKDQLIKDKNDKIFLAALVSTNKEFINWIKLRLGFFKKINNIEEVLNDKNEYTTDGYIIELNSNTKLFKEIFSNNRFTINNSYVLNQYSHLLNINNISSIS